ATRAGPSGARSSLRSWRPGFATAGARPDPPGTTADRCARRSPKGALAPRRRTCRAGWSWPERSTDHPREEELKATAEAGGAVLATDRDLVRRVAKSASNAPPAVSASEHRRLRHSRAEVQLLVRGCAERVLLVTASL